MEPNTSTQTLSIPISTKLENQAQICKSKFATFKIVLTYNSTTRRSKVIEKAISKDKNLFELSLNVSGEELSTDFIWRLYKTPNQIKKLFIKLLNESNKNRLTLPSHIITKLKTYKNSEYSEYLLKIKHVVIFINDLLQEDKVKESNHMLEFLEISCHSFECSYCGKKPFEGYITKKAEMNTCRCINKYLCCCIKCFCCCAKCKQWHKRWFLLKDDMICYFNDLNDIMGKDIFWFDQENTLTDPDTSFSFSIKNNSRSLILKFSNEFDCLLWHKEIQSKIDAIKLDESNIISSFSSMKEKNKCKFFIDASDYFTHLYHKLKAAKESVFIAGWWLSPEINLLRPSSGTSTGQGNEETKLANILLHLAQRGVKIYILIYKEMSLALSLDSRHTKRSFVPLHENIKVTRHPKGKFELLWTHHEKIVIIDQQFAYVGGLDLCWGRYDTSAHVLSERLKRGQMTCFPGIDYSNARVKDFEQVSKPNHDDIDRNSIPRMPWHDVQCYIEGPSLFDLTRHFVERWNFARSIQPQHKIITGVRSSNVSDMRCSENAYLITNKVKDDDNGDDDDDEEDIDKEEMRDVFESKNQYTKTFIGKKTFVIEEEEDYYTSGDLDKRKQSQTSNDNILESLFSKVREGTNQVKNTVTKIFKQKTFNMGGSGVNEADFINMKINSNFNRRPLLFQCEDDSKNIQVLRSGSNWSVGLKTTQHSILDAYYHLISNSKHCIYIENQYFISKPYTEEDRNDSQQLQLLEEISNRIAEYIYNRIIQAFNQKEKFRVIIFLPLLPAFPGDIRYSPTVQEIMKYTYATICRSSGFSLIEKLNQVMGEGDKWKDYIAFYSLRTHGTINETPVTEMIYIHSKLMIVDDDYIIVGSANINDRSMKGSRDSEIALMMTDENKVNGMMDGVTTSVSCFAKQLRIRLMKEHMGCLVPNEIIKESLFEDPLSDELHNALRDTAYNNTMIYRKVFNCYPDDLMVKFNQIPLNVEMTQVELEKLQIEYEKEEKRIIGNIVEFPLHFLEEEVLGRPLFCREALVPIKNFT